ncbi:zinc-binding protein [Thalassovita gelatinovora]|uniref:DNA gyrase inhibitor YacG n=1 Tax=Thalassovita gelatinovora TaxID=53501 RepID=A0A0P1FTZ4_THAGE|nr:DNA gyrase inhibitor YacG [Thalassovita gelatinovora]QIZ80138.1 DNA gyrase inhibitor YacG [Thalassovita gelatinovora]CUH63923.1 zinc-binding protein [Thalassovita gelatinovora]SEQ80146.1 hypothetical protein SAMN04488043_1095 [Thalassovita gelatinovora]
MSCPICSEKSDPKFRPFCSKRCADIDLGRWMSGKYAIPADDPEEAEDALDEIERQMQKPH